MTTRAGTLVYIAVVWGVVSGVTLTAQVACSPVPLMAVGGRTLWRTEENQVLYHAPLQVSAAGYPRAYHPDDEPGLAPLAHAGQPGRWHGLLTNNGDTSGLPLVQVMGDPAVGYHIATTALRDVAKVPYDPTSYVNATSVPFVALPRAAVALGGVQLGDVGIAYCPTTGGIAAVILADYTQDRTPLGVGSIRLAQELGVASSPRNPSPTADVFYLLFPGSSVGWPAMPSDIEEVAFERLQEWGGLTRLEACMGALPSVLPSTGASVSPEDSPLARNVLTIQPAHWVVSVSTASEPINARNEVYRLRQKGYDNCLIAYGRVQQRSVYRVLVGPYLTREQAQQAVADLRGTWLEAWFFQLQSWCRQLYPQRDSDVWMCD